MTADTPKEVAKQGIKALLKDKSFKIVGSMNYVQSFLPRFLTRKAMINVVSGMMNSKVNG